jgi:hypothetical protein
MFKSDLILIAATQPDLWRLSAPLVWSDSRRGTIAVPAGFVTDLASIPRLFRNIPNLDPNGVSRRPAVVHDWFYGSKAGRRWGKDFADTFLFDALLAEGATKAAAHAIYYGVHWFGKWSWDADGVKLSQPNPRPLTRP